MTDLTDLAAWLLTQVDDDEREVRQVIIKAPAPWKVSEYNEIADVNGKGIVTSGDYGSPWMQDHVDDHIARWDPKRVLAECDAKRKLIEAYEKAMVQRKELRGTPHGTEAAVRLLTLLGVIRTLTLPYASRDGYQAEWKP